MMNYDNNEIFEFKMTVQQFAHQRLSQFFPYLHEELERVKKQEPNSKVKLAIVAVGDDDMAKVMSSFECEEFFGDILNVLGYENIEQLTRHLMRKKIQELQEKIVDENKIED